MERESKVSKIFNERKAKTAKGRRVLRERAPKVHENSKRSLILRGLKSTPDISNLLEELHNLRKPIDKLYAKRHDVHPFEENADIEKMCNKLDSSLFAVGSKSKKRPFRLVVGRLFDSHILDMHEFGVSNYVSSTKFKALKPMFGSKPLVIFQGAAFEQHPKLKNCRSLLLDFFRGAIADKINLQHIDHAIIFTALDSASVECPTINFRHYYVSYQKSAQKLPRVQMSEIGPRFDLSLDREKAADPHIMKLALKVPKEVKAKKVKNIETDMLGRKHGRIHMGRQDFEKIHTPHFHKRKADKDSNAPQKKRKAEKDSDAPQKKRKVDKGSDAPQKKKTSAETAKAD
eukprot:GEMP01040497.1.p1 GENE.GEMP01040497.1~~GEMP01040497.1.p1  ORF type:complete len:345 (+),score=68.04 GEMP01040497.1:61-1095(+)